MNEFSLQIKKIMETSEVSNMGACEMGYEPEDIELNELKAVKLEEVEKDYVEFRREMGEE